jgi:hypothetical protein
VIRLRRQLLIALLVPGWVFGMSALATAQFETRSSAGVLGSSSRAVGAFNRDGKPDIAVANENLQVLLGNGDGTF